MATQSQIEILTNLLRTSPDPIWARHRELLVERGIDPSTSILAQSFPDDAAFEFGILVTHDRHVIQFGLDYLHKSVGEGRFTEWEDITDCYRDTPYSEYASAAIALLETETSLGPE